MDMQTSSVMMVGNDLYFYYTALLLYLFSGMGYSFAVILKREKLTRISTVMLAIGLLAHTVSIAVRYYEAGHPPWTDVYESLSVVGWSTSLVLLVFFNRIRIALLGAIVLLVNFLIMAFGVSMYSSPTIQPPAILNSIWLIIHVSLTLVAYGGFTVAFGLAILYLVQERRKKRGKAGAPSESKRNKLPTLDALDSMCYKAVSFAFPFMTFGGLVAGAIWANESWGTYWAWDPKETMSLVTWVVYGGYLHARVTSGWRGHRAAILAIAGFAAVIFTFYGVGFLLPGLHSYLGS